MLDFEKPVLELEEKLTKLQESKLQPSAKAEQIKKLKAELHQLKKNIYTHLSGWQKVQLSRHPLRPYSLDYIENICTDFMELHGDRKGGDDPAIVGGFAKIEGQSVMIIGQQKGRSVKEKQFRNFGMSGPEGYRKALRLMKLAEKFNKPVICLIDTPGASPGLEAEAHGQAEAIATNLQEMMQLKTSVISVIIGEGAAGGALALAISDRLLMMDNTWFSVISPEVCSSILWNNWDYKEKAADQMKLTAQDLCKFKLIDGIISEPLGGAHKEPQKVYINLKKALLKHLKELQDIEPEKKIKARIKKYSQMGIYTELTSSD
jgi:acetyl-CoA carboxylase carboxyl transferase subunit alpha